MGGDGKRLAAVFFRTEAGGEPVRAFIAGFDRADRRAIGVGIATVEFGWPIGLPGVRPLGHGLHEVRVTLESRRIVRIFFYVSASQRMVLLHGFIKKSERTPIRELETARERLSRHRAAEPRRPDPSRSTP